jgi:hypothetical protein
MSDGCTSCGNKGGCDHRKTAMFAAIDDALARLYPTRRWAERDGPGVAAEASQVGSGRVAVLAAGLSRRLGDVVLVPGGADGWCDFIYVLCVGRRPSILEAREARVSPGAVLADRPDADTTVEEVHLRVACSSLAPFAAVQQVTLTMVDADTDLIIEERPRSGVFDPVLLPRFRTLIAVLTEHDLRHLDFGDLTQPPAGFDGTAYRALYGVEPNTANYLFYTQPCTTVVTTAHPARASALADSA